MNLFEQVIKEMMGLYNDLELEISGNAATKKITQSLDLILYFDKKPEEWDVIDTTTREAKTVKEVTGAPKLIILEFVSSFKDFMKEAESKQNDPVENLRNGGFEIPKDAAETGQEVISDADKLAMLDDIMDGKATPANISNVRAPVKHQPMSKSAPIVPSNISTKQVMELTQQDVINYICPEATPQEAMIFLKLCQARDINPFLKEAYLIKYKPSDPASMVVARDYFTRKADEYPQYDGYEAGIIIKKEDGSFERREGTFMVSPEELIGGWCKVYRKDRTKPHIVEVSLKEYQQRKSDGSLNRFWNDKTGKPATMIRKVAVSQCHREAFPGKFSGMYDSSEIAGGMEALEESIIEASYQEVEA